MFENKILLITGGTGSFGNAVMKRFLNTDIKEIRIFSRDEKKQDEMRNYYKSDKLKFYIGDVRDFNSLESALINVNYVFHAAALKQVPSCEFFPMEAVKTNVMGTENVLRACIQKQVEKVICLSTDKAAYPINAMGISKALMEKIVISQSRNSLNTVISATRYGNVMASRGSVIPLFIDQIFNNSYLTITNPDMTRFLMTLDNAVDLVLYSFNNANSGDLMIQKSPSCRIGDLAIAISELFEVLPNLKVIGSRHSEKLYETLLTKEEFLKAEDLGTFYRVPADNRDLNYDKFLSEGDKNLNKSFDYNSNNTKILSVNEIKEMLLQVDYVVQKIEEWKSFKNEKL
jgi:UDP-N-acetylglucosamine 4,6-dehydratase